MFQQPDYAFAMENEELRRQIEELELHDPDSKAYRRVNLRMIGSYREPCQRYDIDPEDKIVKMYAYSDLEYIRYFEI